MDSDWATCIKEVNGIDLANYLPQKRSYNSVVYIHKKYFQEHNRKEENNKVKKFNRSNLDTPQQFNAYKNIDLTKEKVNKISDKNENSVLEQTIKFAKNIVPLVLPPDEDKSQVFYTIKTAKKRKKQDKKHQDLSFEHPEPSNDKEESKKVIETYRKVRKESVSVKESFSHSSNNTLDDLNINQSLSCTFSEVSEKRYKKTNRKNNSNTKKLSQDQKFSISNSFEAIATDQAAGEGKIKIHLMNEKDKELLSNTIKEPILKALEDCILKLQNMIPNTEVQKFVKCNSQKLDNIIDKLTCIEKILDDLNKQKADLSEKNYICDKKLAVYEKKLHSEKYYRDDCEIKNNSNENGPSTKTENRKILPVKLLETKSRGLISTLEDLAEDVVEIKEDYTSEEELHHELLDRRSKITLVEELEPKQNNAESLGGGELPRSVKNVLLTEVKLERPKRMPARFCWTGKSN